MRTFSDMRTTHLESGTVLTVGVFDGVHRGHQHLFAQLLKIARERRLLAGAVALDPHPREVLQPEKPFRYLTTLEERIGFMEEAGLDLVVVQPFTPEFSLTPAREFVRLLKDNLRMQVLVAGPDFALGHGREGDLYTLRKLGQELGFDLEVVEPLYLQGLPVRSTTIRALVQEGKVAEAASFLGRPPTVSGTVSLHGDTLTLKVWEKQLLPAAGLYACRVHWERGSEWAVASVQSGEQQIEIHSLRSTSELSGQKVRLQFMQRLPPDTTLEEAERLVAEMERVTS